MIIHNIAPGVSYNEDTPWSITYPDIHRSIFIKGKHLKADASGYLFRHYLYLYSLGPLPDEVGEIVAQHMHNVGLKTSEEGLLMVKSAIIRAGATDAHIGVDPVDGGASWFWRKKSGRLVRSYVYGVALLHKRLLNAPRGRTNNDPATSL